MMFDSGDALNGLIGGTMIGVASAIILLVLGRVAGVSGIAATLVSPGSTNRMRNVAFIIGLIAVPMIYSVVIAPPVIGITDDLALLFGGGLLVGIGTRIGNGCTSGHGVCGVSRLSARSIVASVIFLASGMIVASFVIGAMR